MDNRQHLCPRYHQAVELIGRRWSGAIIFLMLDGPRRFTDLRCAIPDLTDRMLSSRLKELEAEGIVERKVMPETPIRIEYGLTGRGAALAAPIHAIAEWAHEWIPVDRLGTADIASSTEAVD